MDTHRVGTHPRHAAAVPVPPGSVTCAGVPIAVCGPDEAARAVLTLTLGHPRRGADVHLCNAYTLALAHRDTELRRLLRDATMNLPDGQSVVWANRLAHRHRGIPRERVYGPDLVLDVFRLGLPLGLRHYLLGSTPEVLAGMRASLQATFPDARIAGSYSPPFQPPTSAERRDQTDRLRQADAQVVWVGLGTPKQDREVAALAAELPAVFVAVGAAFDFIAGTKPQAPRWMREHGLEWTFRLGCEPRRLWKRYLFGNIGFVYAVARRAGHTAR